MSCMKKLQVEWDENKNNVNLEKYGVSFGEAQMVFFDPMRVIAEDLKHSDIEKRYYCIGMVDNEVITVRFTYRNANSEIKFGLIVAVYQAPARPEFSTGSNLKALLFLKSRKVYS